MEAQDNFKQALGEHIARQPKTELARPPISPRWTEIAASLMLFEEDGVRVFNGGPMDYRGYHQDQAWLIPAEVEDAEGFTNFHVLYLNCTPQNAGKAPVELSFARSVALKVGDANDPNVAKLHRTIMESDGKPKIIVRPSLIGSLYFPKILTQADIPTPSTLARRLLKLGKTLNLDLEHTDMDLEALAKQSQGFVLKREYPNFLLGEAEPIDSEAGRIYMYPVISADDPWKYYQVFTSKPIDEIDKSKPKILRTDSGCDIGQLYRDLGCDCRDQLIAALREINREENANEGGIIVHIPTQDGRGYGMLTKMETEGIKRGDTEMIFNAADEEKPPMDTIQAAQKVFDEAYDPRTFDGTARVLSQLGFQSVIIYTDNVVKVRDLERGGLTVERRPTKTKGNGWNDHHIAAKHRTDGYFHGDA